ncbi:MAG: IS200/IS605 family transposase [Bacteroidales bacterium]|jgi:REP element-mobilizing transposase RayT|nr:IS200/IS605 family transposase [Bacteroidales bacterium]MDD2630971.1 IS200/IS605 family transposase [Bacteroidales bacterium]MDD3132394.1 IS200/IS605 family transposase [Bacteroidales bacterium]MDD4176976.1 IS200/IS605 family transposase [Bacteroidales bacterium]MDD4740351.1 IS200/IS605 family transposase [Bacteroidales bacterium]
MKPGAFTQLYLQLVFAVKNRDAVLHKDIRARVFEYMSGIITNMNHKSIIVGGVADHVHVFIGWNPTQSVSDTVHDIKRNSSLFINEERLCHGHFEWQAGYGGFSYGRSQVENVYNYILNQEQHHKKVTFRDEYIEFLKRFEIEYDERFLFKFMDNI